MSKEQMTDNQIPERADRLLRERQNSIYFRTDRMFAVLLICQWLAGIAIAIWISPKSWHGHYSDVHIHVWTAIFLGGLIIVWPLFLAIKRPGEVLTRHVIAIGQTLYSALLIHLTGGRIETHFHVFGSLAFLSFYNDWRVLVTASAVVGADHIVRGYVFPQSVYGVNAIEPWRWLEHVWWVVFEDIFLIRACLWQVREMRALATRQAEVEAINNNIEQLVKHRTEDLNKAQLRLAVQYEVARIVTAATSLNEAIVKILAFLSNALLGGRGKLWAGLWTEQNGVISCTECVQLPPGSLADFERASRDLVFSSGQGLPGRIFARPLVLKLRDFFQDNNFFRSHAAKEQGLTAALAFPLMDTDKVLGVIEFFAEEDFDLDTDTIELLESLGSEIGQLIVLKKTETERAHLASVVMHSSDAIFTRNREHIITSWNRGAERLLGYTAEEAIGKNSLMLVAPEKRQEILEFISIVNDGQRVDNFEGEALAQDGSLVAVSASWAPIKDESNNVIGCSVTMRDISERKLAEKRVGEFYSMVSHELRTPLTSIRGVLGLIEGNVVEGEEATELVGVARGSADRLIRLINDMLDLKKVEAGKMELKRAKLDVEDLVSESLQSLKGMADSCNIKLTQEIKAGDCIFGDWDKSTQIVTNLVSNAIKFSPEGSEVKVMAAREGKNVKFWVTDNGPGISQENIDKLFEKFQQVDSSDSREKGGTGLGLAITKALVELQEGAIGVESVVGAGSKFWFELPLFVERERAPIHVAAGPSAGEDTRARTFEVLLVENDGNLSGVLRTFIESQGYQVTYASTLCEAIKSFETAYPDVVVLDLGLPDGNGLDLIENLRNSSETQNIPIIVIAGEQKQENVLGGGMIIDWLSKPFDGDQLVNAIDRAIGLEGACKVLVVDDDLDTRRILSVQLKAMGLQCIEAHDGAEAIQMARAQSPDLIILDVIMPNVNGFEVVNVLSKEKASATPLLIYSCSDLSPEDRQSLTLGITRYLVKGNCSASDLAQSINELLGRLKTSPQSTNGKQCGGSTTVEKTHVGAG